MEDIDNQNNLPKVNHMTAATTNDDANEINCDSKMPPSGLKFGEAITIRPGDMSKSSEQGGTVQTHPFDMNFKAEAAASPEMKRSSYNPVWKDTDEMNEVERDY